MPNVHGQPQPGELVTLNDGTTAEVKSCIRDVPRDSAHMVELRKPCRQEFAKVRSYTHTDGWREMVPDNTDVRDHEPEWNGPSHWVAFKSVLPWLLAGMALALAMMFLEWLARG
jgi:hypothetical protein